MKVNYMKKLLKYYNELKFWFLMKILNMLLYCFAKLENKNCTYKAKLNLK